MNVQFTCRLMRQYTPDDEIVIAWWDRTWFEQRLDRNLTDEQWHEIVRQAEPVIEWSDMADQLLDAAWTALNRNEVSQ